MRRERGGGGGEGNFRLGNKVASTTATGYSAVTASSHDDDGDSPCTQLWQQLWEDQFVQ